MSALPKPDTYPSLDHSPFPKQPPLPKTAPLTFLPKQQLPTALQVLLGFQQATSWITLGVVCITLGIYGWTVYTPLRWSQKYQQLQALQKTERQLVANTEAIKHQLAQEADLPSSGLVNPSPDQNIFLPTKQNTTIVSKAQTVAVTPGTHSLTVKPIAY